MRSFCSIGAGTTAPELSASWASVQRRNIRSSCDRAPLFEEMLVRSGIILAKYWFSVNDEEQEKRFQDRMRNPIKRWKLSAMDVESRRHWVDYSQAKDLMFAQTDTKVSPWYVVNADNKKQARLNCIAHLLSRVPYNDLNPVEIALPPRQSDSDRARHLLTAADADR